MSINVSPKAPKLFLIRDECPIDHEQVLQFVDMLVNLLNYYMEKGLDEAQAVSDALLEWRGFSADKLAKAWAINVLTYTSPIGPMLLECDMAS